MVWTAIIGAGAALLGASASKGASDNAARKQAEADKAKLDFEKKRYEDWKNIYGDVEKNLSSYYNDLSPELRTAQGLEAFEREKEVALTQLRSNLAQRGISTSGIAAQTETDIAIGSAEERARIRAAAPMEVAREKANFLSVGMGNNPAGDVGRALGDQASRASSRAAATARASGQATQAAIEAGANLAEELVDVFSNKESD